MGFKRSVDKMEAIEGRLRTGMAERGLSPEAQEEILRAITAFALYGFPESHAASFALIAYASAYLKAHHPTAFYLSLLNAWPMGFYHPASLVKDAQRHGVEVRPIDAGASGWRCRWETREDGGEPKGVLRLGLRFVKGLRRAAGEAIEREQGKAAFADPDDLARRCRLRAEELAALAEGGALASFGLGRRAALWQAARAGRGAGPLLAGLPDDAPSPLPEMTPVEETLADFATARLTTGPHPVAHLRGWLDRQRVVTTRGLGGVADGRRVRTAGAVIVRQRPGTAKGVLFLTLEDETGMAQAIVHPATLERFKAVIAASRGLVVEGILQRRDGSASVLAEKLWPLDPRAAAPSHDWR
jgi:error-prone DNA polymerase